MVSRNPCLCQPLPCGRARAPAPGPLFLEKACLSTSQSLHPLPQSAVEVTAADQAAINEFNRLFQRSKEVAASLKAAQANVDGADDAASELALADEDDVGPSVRFLVGECFYHCPTDEAEARAEAALAKARSDAAAAQAESDAVAARVAELKAKLYARLGDSINLEA